MTEPVLETSLPLELIRRGKVRDVYALDKKRVLMVATDRISAFDVVMNEGVRHKGAVLTQLTAWWLAQLKEEVPSHLLSADAEAIVRDFPVLADHLELLRGRAMLCRRAEPLPVECVVRGYMSGSAWKEYSAHGTLAGQPLREGIIESQQLVPAIFSPATKADEGHDENITPERMAEIVGPAAPTITRWSRRLYDRGRALAADHGVIIADTKFEFGLCQGHVILIDEVMTPDSSRFWPLRGYAPGKPQPSFDKQPLRDYLDGERRAGRWNGEAPPPPLPVEIVEATSQRYLEIFKRLTGKQLPGV